MPPRDVDRLDPVPDERLKEDDKAYLVKHDLEKLFNDLLTHLIVQKPLDPVQFVIDTVLYNADYAKQVRWQMCTCVPCRMGAPPMRMGPRPCAAAKALHGTASGAIGGMCAGSARVRSVHGARGDLPMGVKHGLGARACRVLHPSGNRMSPPSRVHAAWQDPNTGLPEHRKAKLLDVFRVMDKVSEGLGRPRLVEISR